MDKSSSPKAGRSVLESLGIWVMSRLERVCIRLIAVSLPAGIAAGGLFGMYVVVGGLGRVLRVWHPPYSFLSLQSDPYFNILAALCGVFICLETGAFILLAYMGSPITGESDISTLAAFIGFGFGSAILRWTLPTALLLFS